MIGNTAEVTPPSMPVSHKAAWHYAKQPIHDVHIACERLMHTDNSKQVRSFFSVSTLETAFMQAEYVPTYADTCHNLKVKGGVYVKDIPTVTPIQ